jgi:hypothetical protein
MQKWYEQCDSGDNMSNVTCPCFQINATYLLGTVSQGNKMGARWLANPATWLQILCGKLTLPVHFDSAKLMLLAEIHQHLSKSLPGACSPGQD